MFIMEYLLFYILLLLFLGAVIAFSYFVIKPLQTRWAIVKARKIVAENKIKNTWQFRNVYRMLATARNDLEAVKLWQQLDEIREKTE
jgi:quinol-cytochrome oxidoreductase complex cytochrome b subunit